MAFSEICRICLSVNVRMFTLKNTGLQNLFKTLKNSFRDEDEEPIIVCFTCHARLVRCRRLQQQVIESNAVLQQLLAGGSMSTPKLYEARDKIQFTTVYHIDIWPVECDIENDCKDNIFNLESVKVEEENFQYENSKFELNGNHDKDTAEKQEDLEIDAFEDRQKDSENELPLISLDAKSKTDDFDIEQPCIQTNSFSKPCRKKIKSNSTKKFLTKDILADHIYSHKTQTNSDAVQTQVEQTPVPQLMDIYNCNVYEFKTSHKRYILAHLKAHVAKQVYCCNNCEYKCTDKANLRMHMKIHTGEKPFSCNICEYRCITKSNFQTHMKKHTGEKPFSCNICEFKFITKGNLQRHMKIHTGEKPFSCNICEFRCITKDALRRHMKIHTGEKPFSCRVCQYRCITKGHLQRHMKIHTREKPFLCNICELRCIKKSNLQTHMKIHTGEKPFSCNICEFRFITKGNLQRHMKIHTGEKPFSCRVCQYRCITKGNLQTHMKKHTATKSSS